MAANSTAAAAKDAAAAAAKDAKEKLEAYIDKYVVIYLLAIPCFETDQIYAQEFNTLIAIPTTITSIAMSHCLKSF
jgi:hypothetical protein